MLTKTIRIKKEETKRKYFSGLTLFFFTHSTCRLFYFLRKFFYLDLITLSYIGRFLGVLSVVFIVIAIESAIFMQSKHIFTCIGIVGVVLDFIDIFLMTEFELNLFVQTYIISILTSFIILVFLSYIFKSSGTVRNHFILMTLGILLIGAGEISNVLYDILWWTLFAAPLFMLSGLIILFISIIKYYKEPQPSKDIMDKLSE